MGLIIGCLLLFTGRLSYNWGAYKCVCGERGYKQYSTVFTSVNFLKVKNDHRSKFSNLSNWKEEA